MNFRTKKEHPPLVDLGELHREIMRQPVAPDPHLAYAPPHVRNGKMADQAEPAINHIESFGALPTKEIDEIVAAAEAEIASLKEQAQALRDLYSKHTARITADIKRLRDGVKLSMDMMSSLRDRVVELDRVNPVPSVTREETQEGA